MFLFSRERHAEVQFSLGVWVCVLVYPHVGVSMHMLLCVDSRRGYRCSIVSRCELHFSSSTSFTTNLIFSPPSDCLWVFLSGFWTLGRKRTHYEPSTPTPRCCEKIPFWRVDRSLCFPFSDFSVCVSLIQVSVKHIHHLWRLGVQWLGWNTVGQIPLASERRKKLTSLNTPFICVGLQFLRGCMFARGPK